MGTKLAFILLETTKLQEAFPSITNSIFTGYNMLDAPVSTTHFYFWSDACVYSTYMNKPIWTR
jgi:hypothetical protein